MMVGHMMIDVTQKLVLSEFNTGVTMVTQHVCVIRTYLYIFPSKNCITICIILPFENYKTRFLYNFIQLYQNMIIDKLLHRM